MTRDKVNDFWNFTFRSTNKSIVIFSNFPFKTLILVILLEATKWNKLIELKPYEQASGKHLL